MKRLFLLIVALAFSLIPATADATPSQEIRMTAPAAPAAPVIDTAAPPVAPPAAPAAPAQTAAVPEWLKDAPADMQDSFKQYGTVADALKAHQELRTRLGAKAKPVDDMSINPDPQGTPATIEEIRQIVESVGLNTKDIAEQWDANGQLTEDQYKKFAAKGFGRKAVDSQLAMETQLRAYQAKEIRAEATKVVGGEQQLEALKNWARQDGSLTAAEREWYHGQIANPTSAVRAVEWLNSRYTQAVGAGKAQPLIEGGGASHTSGGAYASRAEFLADRNNPEYREGTPHFAKVQARMRATPSIANLR